MVGGICASFAVLSGLEEEEEGDPGEVPGGVVSWGVSLGSVFQGLDDFNKEELHSCWRRIFLILGHHLASQTKVKFTHAVVAEVVGTHR